ncbi:hypothetical protein M885DRAFT_565915 [Pelagophyceae sp. CCMP2097]|nr:hypothetical protein M885DRAFT_565915 [Pelagophyceae sp. CCMP2097]
MDSEMAQIEDERERQALTAQPIKEAEVSAREVEMNARADRHGDDATAPSEDEDPRTALDLFEAAAFDRRAAAAVRNWEAMVCGLLLFVALAVAAIVLLFVTREQNSSGSPSGGGAAAAAAAEAYAPSASPTAAPSSALTPEPSRLPTRRPTRNPRPTVSPTEKPSLEPAGLFEASLQPTYEPSVYATYEPSVYATYEPSVYELIYEPSLRPTLEPSQELTFEPTFSHPPTMQPTNAYCCFWSGTGDLCGDCNAGVKQHEVDQWCNTQKVNCEGDCHGEWCVFD